MSTLAFFPGLPETIPSEILSKTYRKIVIALEKLNDDHDLMARKLPPLNAVKAFEACARHRSFSPAARELGVTPGAVSQQVKILEGYFAKDLFVRQANQVRLTDAGLAVYAECADIIDRLAAMTQRLMEGDVRSRFVVSTLPSVAVRWLNHRLGEFLASEPDIRCEIRVEDDPVDFATHHIDLRVSYGEYLYPELVTVPLLRDEVTPLCAPEFLARTGVSDAASIKDQDLIHIDWGASFASYPTWAEWFAVAGLGRRVRVELGHTAMMSSLAIDLAANGNGFALGQKMLARNEIASGRLVAPFPIAVPLGYAYCAVHTHSRVNSRPVNLFIEWMRRNL